MPRMMLDARGGWPDPALETRSEGRRGGAALRAIRAWLAAGLEGLSGEPGEVLDDRTERQGRKEGQPNHDQDGPDEQADE